MVNVASVRQARLFDVLACPMCSGPLGLASAVGRDGYTFDADVLCNQCGSVGVVTNGRPSFHDADLTAPELPRRAVATDLPTPMRELERSGGWAASGEHLLALDVGATIGGSFTGIGLAIEILAHPWSGRAVVEVGGVARSVELFSPTPDRRLVVVDGLVDSAHEWALTVVAGGHPDRQGDQAVLMSVRALVPAGRAEVPAVAPVNRGNPYPQRFDEMLLEIEPDAMVLDLGGGDRRHADPRVLNLEYLPYEAVDFHGDGLHLPLRSDSIDLILSQAVLEHVPDPAAAVAEIHRVLRPGGLVLTEIAFMQPLHAVPFHFFNVTPHGAALLFSEFEVIRSGSMGGLAVTLEWIFRLLDAPTRIGPDVAEGILKHLSRLDETLTATELDQVASAVFVEARKRC